MFLVLLLLLVLIIKIGEYYFKIDYYGILVLLILRNMRDIYMYMYIVF